MKSYILALLFLLVFVGCDDDEFVMTPPAGGEAGTEAGAEVSACEGLNPSETCFDTGCDEGQECLPTGNFNCVPSTCDCDEETGEWACTQDCGESVACQ
jgi:hypothetical protein